jgi:hypothetical protein
MSNAIAEQELLSAKVLERLRAESSLRLPSFCRERLAGQTITIELDYGSKLDVAADVIAPHSLFTTLYVCFCAAMYADSDTAGGERLSVKHIKIIPYESAGSRSALRVSMKRHEDADLNQTGKMICAVISVIANEMLAVALDELGLKEAGAAAGPRTSPVRAPGNSVAQLALVGA